MDILPHKNYNIKTLYITRGENEKILEKMERNYKRYSYGYRVAVVCRICDFRGDGKMNISKIALYLAPIPLLIEIIFYFIEN